MTYVIPNTFANCYHQFALEGSSHQFGFSVGLDLVVNSSPDDLASDVFGAFAALDGVGFGIDNIYPQWTFVRVAVTWNQGGVLYSGEFIANEEGTNSANEVPPANVSMIVKKRTGIAGKKFRGRMYIPCLSLAEASVDDAGNIDPSRYDELKADVDNWFTQLGGIDNVNAIVLFHDETTPGDKTPTPISSFQLEAMVATQRRRLR